MGTGSSAIGKTIAEVLSEDFSVIKTSKNDGDTEKLDITSVDSIKSFVSKCLKENKKPLETIFLNSGVMNRGNTINRSNFYRRSNNGDPSINTHLYNVVLLERLQQAGLITPETKVIYNASVQIFE